jgi:hypothetical protein
MKTLNPQKNHIHINEMLELIYEDLYSNYILFNVHPIDKVSRIFSLICQDLAPFSILEQVARYQQAELKKLCIIF